MSTRSRKKSNNKPFYINIKSKKSKKSAKIKMKNKGGVIGLVYKPPTINKRRATIKSLTIKELTPSPLSKEKNTLAKTLAKSRIARTLKKRFLISKKLAYDKTCLICLDDMKDIKDITLTSCKHIYHTTCIEKWLSNPLSQNRCPKCKTKIRKTSSKNASGLTLSQIEQLRAEMQNIEPTMHKELIKKLCTCQKFLWILKKKINWVINNWPIIFASYFESDDEMQEMTEWMNNLETLINKIIAIYSDVFPDYKHLFQVINNSNVIPFSMTIETIERDLQTIVDQLNNIYEDDEALKADLTFWIDTVMDAYNEITEDNYFEPFITNAEIMVNSNNPLTS